MQGIPMRLGARALTRSAFKHLRMLAVALITSIVGSASAAQEDDPERPLFQLDESYWIVFYDLPSRRFRAIRDSFVRREFEAVVTDLGASEGYLRIEAGRSSLALQVRLTEVADRLAAIADNIDDPVTVVNDLDPVFARAHWLLAQHFLELATANRDRGNHKNAANYLIATAHHLERTILWSNARIDDATLDALDGMREIAHELRTTARPAKLYERKPIDRAWQTLRRLGEHLDRPVVATKPSL